MNLLNCLGRDTVRRLGNVLAELFRQGHNQVRRLENVLAELRRQGHSQKTGKCTC